jgi:hypothetical protein
VLGVAAVKVRSPEKGLRFRKGFSEERLRKLITKEI